MSINLQLPPDVEARYAQQAREKGRSLDEFLRDYLIDHAPASGTEQMSVAEWERSFEELIDEFPQAPLLSDEAISREKLYTREDEL